jgi:hypothetical protein
MPDKKNDYSQDAEFNQELEERINDLFGLETLPEVTSDLAKGFPDWDLDISMIEVDSEQ